MNIIRALLIALFALPLLYIIWGNDGFILHDDVAFAVLSLGVERREVDVRLIFVVLFLLGFVPVWLLGLVQRALGRRREARLQRRLDDVETELEQAKVELLRPPAAPRGSAAPMAPAAPAEAPPAEPPAAPEAPGADPLADPEA